MAGTLTPLFPTLDAAVVDGVLGYVKQNGSLSFFFSFPPLPHCVLTLVAEHSMLTVLDFTWLC